MFNKRNWLIVLFTLVLAGGAVLAQDAPLANDPAVNPDANACFAGGSMAGTCVDESDWIAGWIKIRWENGLIADDEIAAGWESYMLNSEGFCAVDVDEGDSADEDVDASGFDVYRDGDFQYFITDTTYDEC